MYHVAIATPPALPDSTPRRRRWPVWALAAITLAGLALRLYQLDAQSIWYDEGFSVVNAALPLAEMWRQVILDVVHPPLHYLLLHAWFRTAGVDAAQARLVSVVFGTLSIPLLYLLARRFAGPAASLMAAALLAVSQLGVYYSQEARPYAMAQCLSLLAALAFLRFLEQPRWGRTLLLIAAGCLLLHTHYYGAATLAALGLYACFTRSGISRAVWIRLALVAAAWTLLLAPWIAAVHAGGRLTGSRFTRTGGVPNERLAFNSLVGTWNRFNNGKLQSFVSRSTPVEVVLYASVFGLPAFCALWCTSRRQFRAGAVLGWLLAGVPVAVAFGVGLAGFHFGYRHYSFAVPGYCLAVAVGWRYGLPSWPVRAAWVAAAAVLMGFAIPGTYAPTRPDYRTGFQPLAERYRQGDCFTGRQRLWGDRVHFGWDTYYLRSIGPLRLVPAASLREGAPGCERIWVVNDHTPWMNRPALEGRNPAEALKDSFRVTAGFSHASVDLELLERRQPSTP